MYANSMSFYIRDLSIFRFWYLLGILEPISLKYQRVDMYQKQVVIGARGLIGFENSVWVCLRECHA